MINASANIGKRKKRKKRKAKKHDTRILDELISQVISMRATHFMITREIDVISAQLGILIAHVPTLRTALVNAALDVYR